MRYPSQYPPRNRLVFSEALNKVGLPILRANRSLLLLGLDRIRCTAINSFHPVLTPLPIDAINIIMSTMFSNAEVQYKWVGRNTLNGISVVDPLIWWRYYVTQLEKDKLVGISINRQTTSFAIYLAYAIVATYQFDNKVLPIPATEYGREFPYLWMFCLELERNKLMIDFDFLGYILVISLVAGINMYGGKGTPEIWKRSRGLSIEKSDIPDDRTIEYVRYAVSKDFSQYINPGVIDTESIFGKEIPIRPALYMILKSLPSPELQERIDYWALKSGVLTPLFGMGKYITSENQSALPDGDNIQEVVSSLKCRDSLVEYV